MRGILGLVLLAAAFSAYWYVAAYALRHQHAVMGQIGLNAEAVSVSGFPAWFRVDLQNPSLPGHGWSAPMLRAQARSPWPFAIDGTIGMPQTLRGAGAAWQVDGDSLRFALRTDPALSVRSARLEGSALHAVGPVTARVAQLSVGLGPSDTPTARVLEGRLDNLTLPGVMPGAAQGHITATLGYDRIPGLRGTARLDHVALTDLRLDWDSLQVQATGQVARGPDGRLDGTITLTVTGWRNLLVMLRSTGLLPPDQAPMIEMMAQSMASNNRLTLPLTLVQSTLRLGPLTLMDLGAF